MFFIHKGVTQTETQVQLKPGLQPPFMLCQDSKHLLHCCPEFKGKSLEERRKYVKEKRLCYGCLKSGRSAKDCHNRHSCNKCKGRYPSLLYDENYSIAKPMSVSNQNTTEETATTLSFSVTTKKGSTATSMMAPV